MKKPKKMTSEEEKPPRIRTLTCGQPHSRSANRVPDLRRLIAYRMRREARVEGAVENDPQSFGRRAARPRRRSRVSTGSPFKRCAGGDEAQRRRASRGAREGVSAGGSGADAINFVEMRPRDIPFDQDGDLLEVVLPSKLFVRVRPGFDGAALSALLDLLERRR